MFYLRVLPLVLAALWSAAGVSSSSDKPSCKKPAVRKEWRAFNRQEKAEWIRAVNCLSHQPHDPALTPSVDLSVSAIPPVNSSGSFYDDLVYVHMDLNTRIHWTGQFLPWHRWYVYAFEQSLKTKCKYNGVSPYWDWTIDAPDFFESSFWKDSDAASGLGGWGDSNADFSVTDGGLNTFHISYPSPHILRRNFTLRPYETAFIPWLNASDIEANATFTAAIVEELLGTSTGEYKNFQAVLEGFIGAHSSVHLIMGGDLGGTCPKNAPSNCTGGPTWSPNEPLFFMHHAMIDKIWFDWQLRNPTNAQSFFGGSVQALESLDRYTQYPNGAPPYLDLNSAIPADGLFPEVTIGDVMNTTSGILCYVYE